MIFLVTSSWLVGGLKRELQGIELQVRQRGEMSLEIIASDGLQR